MEEALNIVVKAVIRKGFLEGIKLFGLNVQHVLVQFVDHASFTLKKRKLSIKRMVKLLTLFHKVSRFEINWDKTCIYWQDKGKPRSLGLKH